MENFSHKEEVVWPEDIFEKNDIVVLGEAHGKYDDVIISFIEKFHSELQAVFYESPVSLQVSYDLYLESGRISDELESSFQGGQSEGKDVRGILKILDKLKEHGIKFVCIDSSKSQTDEYKTRSTHGYYFLRGESRDEDMCQNVMSYFQANPGKYLAICGAGHIAEGKDFRHGGDTFGTKLKNMLPEKVETIDMTRY